MAVAILFTPRSLRADQYEECMRRLNEAGAGTPPGRRYHACFGTGNQLRVFSVWESQEAFDRFGRTLVPILRELGINPGQPEFTEVRNIISAGDISERNEPPRRGWTWRFVTRARASPRPSGS